VGKSLSAAYVDWFHSKVLKWATWEPGDPVEPGTVGRFDDGLVFRHQHETLQNYRIPFAASEDKPVQDRLYAMSAAFSVQAAGSAKVPDPVTGIARAGGSLVLKTTKKNACLLQVKDATSSHLLDVGDVLREVHRQLLDSEWSVDLVVVAERIRAQEGFALVCEKKGLTLQLAVEAEIGLLPELEGYGGSLALGVVNETNSSACYRLLPGATPIFTGPIRVRQSLWSDLLGLPPKLIDPSGGVYQPRRSTTTGTGAPSGTGSADRPLTAGNLTHLSAAERHYDPARSRFTPQQLRDMPLSVLFEELDQPITRPQTGSDPDDDGADRIAAAIAADHEWIAARSRQYQLLPAFGSGLKFPYDFDLNLPKGQPVPAGFEADWDDLPPELAR
jgi:hypothetical protein